MKKRLTIIAISVFITFSLFSQDFISTDKQWNVRLTGWAGAFSTEIDFINGDSVVNSLIYNKIWTSFDSLSTWQYQGLLREDSNIVYYIPPNGNEGILYDFNLEVGDTAYINNIFCTDIMVYVTNIDTIEQFGVARKRWHIADDLNYTEEYWIEGIGSIHGPLYSSFWQCLVCPASDLLCYHESDTLKYIIYNDAECYVNTVGINEKHGETGFTIKPNPIRRGNTVFIETNSSPINIRVFNSAGLLIKNINQISDNKIRIETNNFESGLYFITFKTKENKMITQKIMIK